jgi:hypothetical protein
MTTTWRLPSPARSYTPAMSAGDRPGADQRGSSRGPVATTDPAVMNSSDVDPSPSRSAAMTHGVEPPR